MTTMWAWSSMTDRQRTAALADMAGSGPDGRGMPPSGPHAVIWAKTPQGWRWRSGLFVDDVRKGFAVGRAKRMRARP